MREFVLLYRKCRFDQRAVTSLEYAFIAGLVAVVIVASVRVYGVNLGAVFNKIALAAAAA